EAGTPRHRERAKVGAAMLLDRLKLFCSFGVEIYIQYVYYSGPGGEDVALSTNRSTIATTSFARLTTSGPSPTLTMHHAVYPLVQAARAAGGALGIRGQWTTPSVCAI